MTENAIAKEIADALSAFDKRLGLMINFYVPQIKYGITRIVNGARRP